MPGPTTEVPSDDLKDVRKQLNEMDKRLVQLTTESNFIKAFFMLTSLGFLTNACGAIWWGATISSKVDSTAARFDERFRVSDLSTEKQFKAADLSIDQRFKVADLSTEKQFKAADLSIDQRFKAAEALTEQRFMATEALIEQRFKALELRADDRQKATDDRLKAIDARFDRLEAILTKAVAKPG